jgi:hypothetical protein
MSAKTDKIARSANGIYDEDNFVDLAGYAEMAARVADDESDTGSQSDETASDDADNESSLFEEATDVPAPDPNSEQLTAIEQSLIEISILDEVTLFYDFVTRTGEDRELVWQALSALDERYDAFKLHSNSSPADAEFTFDPTEPTPEPVEELLAEYGIPSSMFYSE